MEEDAVCPKFWLPPSPCVQPALSAPRNKFLFPVWPTAKSNPTKPRIIQHYIFFMSLFFNIKLFLTCRLLANLHLVQCQMTQFYVMYFLHRLFGGVDSWCVFGPKGRLWRIIHRSQTWNSPKTRKEDRFLQFASIHNRSSCFLVKITFSAFQEMLFPCMTNSGQFEHICQLCNCILHCIGYIGGILKRFR